MEWIDALGDVGGLLRGGLLVGLAHVQRHRLKLRLSLVAELVVEGFEGVGVVALFGPNNRAVAVVVCDHREIAMPLAIADVVDPDGGRW